MCLIVSRFVNFLRSHFVAGTLAIASPIMGSAAHGTTLQVVTIEPDNYAHRQQLTNISPLIRLTTAGSNLEPIQIFAVQAYTAAERATTGSKVFAHSGIPFWNSNSRLRMDCFTPVFAVSIDYKSSGLAFNSYVGVLEAYGSGGLLSRYTTSLLGPGGIETMTVSSNTAIDFVIAYPPADPFGDLDHLVFSTPEPSTLAIAALGALGLLVGARRRR